MMGKKHTDGQWKADGLKVTAYGAGIVAKCILPNEGGCMSALENAKLIAKAPELLDALIIMQPYFEALAGTAVLFRNKRGLRQGCPAY
jgi:hypothetical protein